MRYRKIRKSNKEECQLTHGLHDYAVAKQRIQISYNPFKHNPQISLPANIYFFT